MTRTLALILSTTLAACAARSEPLEQPRPARAQPATRTSFNQVPESRSPERTPQTQAQPQRPAPAPQSQPSQQPPVQPAQPAQPAPYANPLPPQQQPPVVLPNDPGTTDRVPRDPTMPSQPGIDNLDPPAHPPVVEPDELARPDRVRGQ